MQHHFTVPAPIEVAWQALLDPERVAPCMPGATITESGEDGFAGSLKVKLGPVSLHYTGKGSVSEVDEDARRVVIEASGKEDAHGYGTASVTVTVWITEQAAGDEGTSSTDVGVDTDLTITGKAAQLGKNVISDVSGKNLRTFADRFARRLGGEPGSESAEEESGKHRAGSDSAGSDGAGSDGAASDGAGSDGDRSDGTGPDGAGRHRRSESVSVDGSAAATPASGGAETGLGGSESEGAAASAGSAEPQRRRRMAASVGDAPGWRVTPAGAAPEPEQEAIDLLDEAATSMLTRVLSAAGALALVIGVVMLIRRLRTNPAVHLDGQTH